MDRTGITVHGTSVHLYARPTDTTTFELRCKSQDAARKAADRLHTARTTKHFDADTPLYAAMLTWAWWGTGHLNAKDSWPKYKSILNKLLPLAGGTRLGDADRDWYSRVHKAAIRNGWTLSNLETFATTFGAFATWTSGSRAIWDGPRPGGESKLQAIHRSYRADARANAATDTPLIRPQHCPDLDQAISFGDTLGALAAKRWGPDYGVWRHAPRIQFVTGCRLMELPALRADSFELDDIGNANVHIARQYVDGTYQRGRPGTGPTKNKKPRNARIWASQVEFLRDRCAEATGRPGRLLLPLPPEIKTGTRQLQDLLKQAIDVHGYQWTSHAHRSAYISWNLATRDEGGYGCSPARVSQWVGHSDIQQITRRYWVPTSDTPDTAHSPGDRIS